MKIMRILHVFPDEKFFDYVSDFFDELNNVENLYIYYNREQNYTFKYIKNTSKIKIESSYKEYVKLFSSSNIDIIYFHSLPLNVWKFFRYIDKNKKIIWWCWGFEIYQKCRLMKPLVQVDLYKPLTLEYVRQNEIKSIGLLRFLYWLLMYPYDYIIRKKIISRIDYFTPVLPIEYQLMKKISYFRAKPFMLNSGPGLASKVDFKFHLIPQNILIGNSLSYTNNHLDVFSKIHSYRLCNQKYVVPVNYGTDFNGNKMFLKDIANLHTDVVWLTDFMPFEQYFQLFETITHAIFGHIRQQAMGNIFACLEKGIKIYLYKDSVIYRQLVELGFIVFSIDNDFSEISLQKVLSKEDAYTNLTCCRKIGIHKIENANQELNTMFKQ